DPATEAYDRIHVIPGLGDTDRTNDGGVAPDGAFWFGVMDDREREVRGWLYRLGPDGDLVDMRIDPVLVTNTFQWSPDGRVFYTCDSAEQEILAFDHDLETGVLTERRLFSSTQEGGGYPDGSAIDEAGCLWNAQWDAGRVVRYAPDGLVDRVIELPVSRPTSCCFGGPDLKTLFITTARIGLDETEIVERQPLAGGLFACEVSTPGLPPRVYGGAR
ncbi:MAG: SMP-30/gluconolactonase/LRE family protein, partial [Pseudomonadota bacterium]